MIVRRLIAALSGFLSGVILAVLSIEILHIDRFALSPTRVLIGYTEAALLGSAVALASRVSSLATIRRGILGGALGLALSFAARIWPTPWVNLYAIGAGGGPAGELPMIVMPLCGFALCAGFFGDARFTSRPAKAAARN